MSELRPSSDAQRALAMERSISTAMRESLAADAERWKAAEAERQAQRRRPRPSQDSSRYISGYGTANYANASAHPPMELVQAVPELAERYQTWQSENAKGSELAAAWTAAERAAVSLFNGRDTDGNRRRREGITIEDVEAAEQRVRQAESAAKRQTEPSLRALKAFDDAAHEPELRALREQLMAPIAIAAHERLKAAWEELRAAAAARSDAHNKAGAPGRPWEDRIFTPLTSTRQTAEGYFQTMIDAFDVRALDAIAGRDNA